VPNLQVSFYATKCTVVVVSEIVVFLKKSIHILKTLNYVEKCEWYMKQFMVPFCKLYALFILALLFRVPNDGTPRAGGD
jgi:hypothetical protein